MWNTSVSFPTGDKQTQDSAGFVTHEKTYLKGVPASRRDATRTDETLATQMGYTVSKVFECDKACYPAGAGYLIDESDSVEYDIKRAFTGEKENLIQLTCEVRDRGKI